MGMHADPHDRDLLTDEPERIDEHHLVADAPTGLGHEVGVRDRLVDALPGRLGGPR